MREDLHDSSPSTDEWGVQSWTYRIIHSVSAAALTARSVDRGNPPGYSPRILSSRTLFAVVDLLAAVILAVIWVIGFTHRVSDEDQQIHWLIGLIAGFVLFVPLVARDWAPVAAWRGMWVAGILCTVVLTFYLPEPPLYPSLLPVLLLTTYSAVVWADRPVVLGTLVVTGLASTTLAFFALVSDAGEFSAWAALVILVTVVVGVLLGLLVRIRRENREALAAERQRTEVARADHAVMEERNRIARDLHDVVAHHMTAIAVQAEAAPLRAGEDAAVLSAQFSAIRQTALAALGEMRGVLGKLRDGEQASLRPPVTDLSGLSGLARSLEQSGHTVELGVDLAGADVPGQIASVVHSVVKESLSNIRRHAPGAPTRIQVSTSPGSPGEGRTVVIVDIINGRATRRPSVSEQSGGGYGQRGMFERVNSVAGALEVRHSPTGYRVHAELPVEAQ